MSARHLDSPPMPSRPQLRLLTAIFGALLAVALSACGSSGPENGLTQDQADKLVGALENLRDDVDRDDCVNGQEKLVSIREDIAAIAAGGDVDEEIIAGLVRLADQTETLLDDCAGETETTTTDEISTSSSTTPTETSTSSTEETDTTTEETDTTSDEEKEPPTDEEPVEPPSDNGPPGPEDNPNDPDGSFEGTGGLSPGQEKKRGASKPATDEPAKPGDEKKRMMGGATSEPADQERESR